MASDIHISEQENGLLAGLQSISRMAYVFGLKPFALPDGSVLGVTIQSLREELYVDPHQGLRQTGSPSPEVVRSALQELVQRGLVEVLDTHPQRVLVRLPFHSVPVST